MGDVRIGPNSEVNDRAAIRADEEAPISIGANANLDIGDDAILHGPLEVGDRLAAGDNAVIFRVAVGDDATVGEDAIIQGPASEKDPNGLTLEIPDGAVIPEGAMITDEASLREALSSTPQTMPDTGGVGPHGR